MLDRVSPFRRPCPTSWCIGVAVVLCSLAASAASASAAQVSGRVFNDFNTNGLFDTNPNTGAVDLPVAGLMVRAYTGTNTLMARIRAGVCVGPAGRESSGLERAQDRGRRLAPGRRRDAHPAWRVHGAGQARQPAEQHARMAGPVARRAGAHALANRDLWGTTPSDSAIRGPSSRPLARSGRHALDADSRRSLRHPGQLPLPAGVASRERGS
jgi:hypothetical protein